MCISFLRILNCRSGVRNLQLLAAERCGRLDVVLVEQQGAPAGDEEAPLGAYHCSIDFSSERTAERSSDSSVAAVPLACRWHQPYFHAFLAVPTFVAVASAAAAFAAGASEPRTVDFAALDVHVSSWFPRSPTDVRSG